MIVMNNEQLTHILIKVWTTCVHQYLYSIADINDQCIENIKRVSSTKYNFCSF